MHCITTEFTGSSVFFESYNANKCLNLHLLTSYDPRYDVSTLRSKYNYVHEGREDSTLYVNMQLVQL